MSNLILTAYLLALILPILSILSSHGQTLKGLQWWISLERDKRSEFLIPCAPKNVYRKMFQSKGRSSPLIKKHSGINHHEEYEQPAGFPRRSLSRWATGAVHPFHWYLCKGHPIIAWHSKGSGEVPCRELPHGKVLNKKHLCYSVLQAGGVWCVFWTT